MADIVGRGDFSLSLKKAFDLRARSSYNLAGEIVPVAMVADLEGPPYHSKRGFAHFEQVNAGGAGTFAWIVLTIAAGLDDIGVLRFIERLRVQKVRGGSPSAVRVLFRWKPLGHSPIGPGVTRLCPPPRNEGPGSHPGT